MRRCLAALTAVAMVAVLTFGVHAPPAAAAPGTWLTRINDFRAANGRGRLTEDVRLNAVAQAWTQTMVNTNTLEHNPILASQVSLPWTALGENVGYGIEEASLFLAFVNSSTHRANLLGAYNGIGIGQVLAGGRLWTTHVFIGTTAVLTPPPPPPPPSCPALLPTSSPIPAPAAPNGQPAYVPLDPARLMDSRPGTTTVDGVAAGGGALAACATYNLQVAGRAGIPTTGVGAVILNITATGSTTGGFLTVHAAGDPRPLASNLNFTPGQTIPNLVVAKVGAFDLVSLYNDTGTTNVIVDVAGWLPIGGGYNPVPTARLLDSRPGGATIDAVAAGTGALGPGATQNLQVTGRAGVPASGVGAVILNVTATGSTTGGYLTVHAAGDARPLASNLNFAAGQTVPNLVVAKVGAFGLVSIYNASGSTQVIADIAGWLPVGSDYTPLSSARLMDTRPGGTTIDGVADGEGAIAPGSSRSLQVTGRAGVPASGVGAVVLNVTVTGPTTGGYLTVFPSGTARPNASNLNFGPGQTIANSVVAKVGAGGQVSIYNDSGSTQVIVDIAGWMAT